MRIIYTLLIGITLSLVQKRIYAATAPNPFTTLATISHSSNDSALNAIFVSLNGHIANNKVILEWRVSKNETADQFEVEKSSDGKKFSMAAIVFGTDKPETDQYLFYEKANPKKVSYRIKLIGKNREAVYSPVIEIDPKTSTQN